LGRGEACTGFWWGNLREGDHMGDPGVIGRIIRECTILNKQRDTLNNRIINAGGRWPATV
jgi:hypothetical protein